MKYKNSFFRLSIKEDGTYLDLYPALKDGKALEIKEIIDFIVSKGCPNYSLEVIKQAFSSLKDKPVQVRISGIKIEPYNESATITVSPDKMVAYMRFYPPSTGGKLMDKREIIAELERAGITYGIADNIIDVFMSARQYCLNIPVAKGKKPIYAKDTQIEYYFETKPLAKPKMLEDGSVDFHELNLFIPVSKGDVLAKLIPHEQGQNGIDIYGENVLTNSPKVKHLKYGRNITISEDKTVLTSNINGNVSLTDDTVFVADTYNVAADVDASTGDIDYEGSVVVAGTVKTGFTVKAKGDIQVNGVVEGATLIAGGNIVIKRGVQGMSKGELIAGGDICAQFFESAKAVAKGNVLAGSILHSNIQSGGKIVVSSKKGFIIGGEIVCESSIEVNSIGNKMETQTIIKVGVKPELYDEMKVLVAESSALNEQIEEISSYLNVYKNKVKNGMKLTPENVKQIKGYNVRLEELNKEKAVKVERLQEIKLMLEQGKKGTIKVYGNAYKGVTIFIAANTYIVKDKDYHCLYRIEGGDIVTAVF